MQSKPAYYTLRDSLRTLRDDLPPLVEAAGASAVGAWRARLERNVLPALDFDLPVLLVAICGGGSTGKSTLLNVLAGRRLADVGFRAGLTRRVLLAGHPEVLRGPEVASALLHRLPAAPVPWRSPADTLEPGPPLYATSDRLPRNLLLIDTPDFDTGDEGRLLNRERAEPVLRTAEVVIYMFTNAVYNNLSNTRFMADLVGGVGGRPAVLIYRISRAASDEEVLDHCRTVAAHLYQQDPARGGLPRDVVGLYRMPESDAVALGEADPRLIPIGDVTAGRPLERLLSDLDVAAIKRHVLGGDLATIASESRAELDDVRQRIAGAALYRRALDHAMTEQALATLDAFPVNEAVALATRLFIETSPAFLKVLRGTGRVVGAPIRAASALLRRFAEWAAPSSKPAPPRDLRETLGNSLLTAANDLRNRLMDDHLIVRAGREDAVYRAAREAARGGSGQAVVEEVGAGHVNLHVPVPEPVRRQEATLMSQDWADVSARLRAAVPDLVGLPEGVEDELRESVREFRATMGLGQRLREAFFASLTALPPLLGVTYTLLTVNPVAGAGLLIPLESLFGVNDLWALVSIPVSAGLSERDRRQLEEMIAPVFRIWLERRAAAIVEMFRSTVAAPVLEALDEMPAPDDPRLARVEAAIGALEEPR